MAAKQKYSQMPLQKLQLRLQQLQLEIEQQPANMLASEEPANIPALQLFMQQVQQQMQNMQKMQEMHQLQLQMLLHTPRVLAQDPIQQLPQPHGTTPQEQPPQRTTNTKQKGAGVGGEKQNTKNSNRDRKSVV